MLVEDLNVCVVIKMLKQLVLNAGFIKTAMHAHKNTVECLLSRVFYSMNISDLMC